MDPQWLNEREARAWRGFQTVRTALTAQLARQLARDSGLTEADYAVLVALSEAPDRRLRARELSSSLGWERSRLSHQISRMQERGTVRREPCEDDARGFDAVLTDQGLAVIREAAPAHLEAVRHCFTAVLTDAQLDTLGDIAEAVVAHIATEHPTETNSGGPAAQRLPVEAEHR